jgi:NAD(P)-dependent dehydrogenase (short-subunit alcohol dehydrogenase family)
MKKVLVIGADSGIGAAVYARYPECRGTSRRPGSKFTFLDVMSPTTYPEWDEKFDEVYYCVGIGGSNKSFQEVLSVNTEFAIVCLEQIANHVNDGGVIKIMSSITASLTIGAQRAMPGVNVNYRMSKVALNMGVVRLSHQFKNIKWQLVHPGYVLTAMTANTKFAGVDALTPEQSAEYLINLPVPDKGVVFLNYDGKELGW